MKSMLCMLRKTASTIPFYREHRSIGISYHTPAIAGVSSPSPKHWRAFLPPRQTYHIC